MTKVRISKKSLKEFPTAIADKIRELQTRYRVNSFTYEVKNAPYSLYCGEGDRYTLFYGDKKVSFEMAAEHNFGASGVRYEVGSQVPMKAGTTILTISYLGGYYLHITNVAIAGIDAA